MSIRMTWIMRIKLFIVAVLVSAMVMACGPNESILKSGANEGPKSEDSANSKAKYDSVDGEVENMRTANFDFILVLKRKDGATMQADDKSFVRTTTPNANRRSLAEHETAVVIGSNSRVPREIMQVLSDRFIVEDFSKPEAVANSNAPANVNIVR